MKMLGALTPALPSPAAAAAEDWRNCCNPWAEDVDKYPPKAYV